MDEFKTKNIFQRMRMSIPELEDYYRKQRYICFEQKVSLSWIRVRRWIHYALLLVLRVRQIFSGLSMTVIGEQRQKTAHPIIYACTHIGWDDVEVAYCALRDPSWLLLGDPRELYKSIEGLMLWMNGVICCDTANKRDRYISKETCVKLLQQGGNL